MLQNIQPKSFYYRTAGTFDFFTSGKPAFFYPFFFLSPNWNAKIPPPAFQLTRKQYKLFILLLGTRPALSAITTQTPRNYKLQMQTFLALLLSLAVRMKY